MLGKKWVDTHDLAVVVTAGRHKGSLGLVDDWTEHYAAVVYLDGAAPHLGDDYVVLPRSRLRLATKQEAWRRAGQERARERTKQGGPTAGHR